MYQVVVINQLRLLHLVLRPNVTGNLKARNLMNGNDSTIYPNSGALKNVGVSWTGPGQIFSAAGVVTQSNLTIDFNANYSNAVYINNGKIYPLSLALNYVIKC